MGRRKLQVPFAMLLALVTLHEAFTVLQAIGSVLMLGGSFITQSKATKGTKEQVAKLDAASKVTAAYPYWHQKGFTERNPPSV